MRIPKPKRRVLLADLEDPMVGIVSYVKNPAVADAQFFALKSNHGPGVRHGEPARTLRQQIESLPTARDTRRLRTALKASTGKRR